MKEFIRKSANIFFLIALVAGVIIGIYLLFNPFDSNEYKYHAYYINNDGNFERAFLADRKRDIPYLIEFYNMKENKSKDENLKGNISKIGFDYKIKIVDTINDKIVKVRCLYDMGVHKDMELNGYMLMVHLHENVSEE